MSAPPARTLVYVDGKRACVKIAGRANVAASVDFKKLIDELMEQSVTCFLLDLSECLLMDSTFLGVLAGFGLKMNAAKNGKPDSPRMELLNPNQRIAELLENLGVAHLFTITKGDAPDGKSVEQSPGDAPTREQVTGTCLEAHKTLMELDPANVARFKDVARFLAEDMKKIKAGK